MVYVALIFGTFMLLLTKAGHGTFVRGSTVSPL